jgi:hypothetical protein
MKKTIGFIVISAILVSCGANRHKEKPNQAALALSGTWQLVSGTLIEKDDTVITDYTKKLSFIKIINATHFAFLKHDLNKGKDSTVAFGAGGGRYFLTDNLYTEHLEYCSDREWEGNNFEFTVTIRNDTLIQSGMEKLENTGINRLNIEKYIRLKN